MALRLINPSRRPLLHVPRLFSSSSSNNNNPPFPPPPPPPSDDPGASPLHPPPNHADAPHTPAPSPFLDIRERLRSSPAPPPPRRIPLNPPRPTGPPAAPSFALDDIKRCLQSFRNNSSRLSGHGDAGAGVGGGATPSFQDLLRNNAAPPAGSPQAGAPNAGDGKSFAMNFESIRRSIRNIDPQQRQRQPNSTFLTNPPESLFGKDTRERVGKSQPGQGKEQADAGIFLTKDYSPEELGKKLAELRPADAGKDGKEWFSLEELQGRIAKLAELERSQENPQFGMPFGFLRQTLKGLEKNDQKKHVKTVQGMSLFANIGGKPLPDYMLNNLPPQEELLERYFHPDHMSGEEKMKLELQKVRDEFKMSENDCGSARVQIAQLTLKIKHLSSVLHKKDKHSRKGLQDMVQRRKKYLKYLRRTDWDSYCLVLSKLGLRDTPEYKAPDYKKTQPTKAQSKKSKSKRKRKMKA